MDEDDGDKGPWLIQMPGGAPYAFAGLWAHNTKLDVTSCTIITAPSIAPINQIHDHMPIILGPEVLTAGSIRPRRRKTGTSTVRGPPARRRRL